MRFRLVVAYHGTPFAGFQKQDNAEAVQNRLDPVLSLFFNVPVQSLFSGRTDTGVHAHGQVLSFEAPKPGFPLDRLPLIANRELPPEIRILHVAEAPDDFHPRFQARVRQYRYRLVSRLGPGAYAIGEHEGAWDPGMVVDPDRLLRELDPLLGAHDFTTFCSVHDPSRSKVRELFAVDAFRSGLIVSVDIWGNAFLRSMVRSILGNLMLGIRKGAPSGFMGTLLESRNPELARARAPAAGLSLRRVFYAGVFGDRDYYRRPNPQSEP